MLRLLFAAKCAPSDFVNSFTPYAVLSTVRLVALVFLAVLVAILFRPTLRARPLDAVGRLVQGLVALNALAGVAALAETIWMWAQARAFRPWCSPASVSQLAAQSQRLSQVTALDQISKVLFWVLYGVTIVVIVGLAVWSRRRPDASA
jgi:hypothetical protein